MKLKIIDTQNSEIGNKELPLQFNEPVRQDLISRAVLALQSAKRQPYGAMEHAGMRHSVRVSKRRRDYRGSYGYGISRIPRKILSRRGRRMNWQGANVPQAVGGRGAHPAKPETIFEKLINKRERRKAIRSAIAATVIKEAVKARGHLIPVNYPFIITGDFENLEKTRKIIEILEKIGLKDELQRSSVKKVRPGKGKSRGRKYKKKTGPLIVVSKECRLMDAARNIPGIKVSTVKSINAELLAPGTIPGRLTLWTAPAIEILEKEKLFC